MKKQIKPKPNTQPKKEVVVKEVKPSSTTMVVKKESLTNRKYI